jgi:hypothetical protein
MTLFQQRQQQKKQAHQIGDTLQAYVSSLNIIPIDITMADPSTPTSNVELKGRKIFHCPASTHKHDPCTKAWEHCGPWIWKHLCKAHSQMIPDLSSDQLGFLHHLYSNSSITVVLQKYCTLFHLDQVDLSDNMANPQPVKKRKYQKKK